MSDDHTPNTFGNIPYLALPTIALVLIVIGVGIATKTRIDDKPKPTPTPVIVVPSNCQVLQEEALFIVMQCTKSTNYKY